MIYFLLFTIVREYGEICNQTRECDERRNLFCSEPYKKCYCDSRNMYTYSYDKVCFSRKFYLDYLNISSVSYGVFFPNNYKNHFLAYLSPRLK